MTTIENINMVSGQETMHPLICVVGEKPELPPQCIPGCNDCYSLTVAEIADGLSLHLGVPGENTGCIMERGVYFHPDLLCDTPLGSVIGEYPRQCRCRGVLTTGELKLIDGCFGKIKEELCHPIDRYSAAILSSHIELLLNYCIKICN